MQTATMRLMTDFMGDRQRLVGWIVRDAITDEGRTYTEAARRWPIALPTLNRLMSGTAVGLRFLRLAERNLNLPRGLLDAVLDGDAARIRAMPGLDEQLRDEILAHLGDVSPDTKRRRRA